MHTHTDTQIICVITLGSAPCRFVSILSVFAFGGFICALCFWLYSFCSCCLMFTCSVNTLLSLNVNSFNRSCIVLLYTIWFHSTRNEHMWMLRHVLLWFSYTIPNQIIVLFGAQMWCAILLSPPHNKYIDIFCWHLKHSRQSIGMPHKENRNCFDFLQTTNK